MIVSQKRKQVNSAQEFFEVLSGILKKESIVDRDKEHFWAVGLNTRNVIVYVELVSLGVLDQCLVRPAEVLRTAIMHGVKNLIVAHNHPSRDLTPSSEDKKVTNKLKECCELMGMELFDHVIISEDNYISLAQEGLL